MNHKTLGTVHTHTHTHTHGYDLKEDKVKKRILGFTKLIIFILIFSICFASINSMLKRKYAYAKTSDFFCQEEDFDVLFFGSSHMYTSVYPMQLWKDYGIISYNMGQTSSTPAISYYNLLLACQEHRPKIIVIDGYMVLENSKIFKKNFSNSMHNTFDPYSLSYMKYLAIKDLCTQEDTINNMVEFLFNFSIYHARWNELEKTDFIKAKTYEKGAETRIDIKSPQKIGNINLVNIYNDEETINMKYLRKIIEYCKNSNIEVLVTYNPFPADDKELSVSKYVQKICGEYNIDYINFLEMDVVDYSIDCYDENSHLNVSGGRKVTDYLGRYLIENYNIRDQRKNTSYEFWCNDYEKYIDFKIEKLEENSKDLSKYILLLYGENDISYDIKISSNRVIEEEIVLYKLLENINNNYEIDDSVFEDNPKKTVKITTWDKRSGKEINTVWF